MSLRDCLLPAGGIVGGIRVVVASLDWCAEHRRVSCAGSVCRMSAGRSASRRVYCLIVIFDFGEI